MGIQFSCNSCSSTLDVKEEFAGKQARCPKCKTVMVVPATDTADDLTYAAASPEQPAQEPPDYQTNPYAAVVVPGPSPQTKQNVGPGQPTAVEAGRIIEHAFEVWKENLGVLVGATLLTMGIGMAIGIAAEIGEVVIAEIAGEPLAGQVFGLVVNNIFGTLVNWFLTIGLTKITLAAARRQSPTFGILFSGGSALIPFAIAGILFGLGFFVGLILLIIPGLIFAIYYWPYSIFIADGQAKAFSSFGEASKITRPNIGTSIVLFLASIGIAIAGLLALCVGIIFAAPLISCIVATAYLMMKGEIK